MTEDKVHEEIALFNEWFGSLECENKPEPLRLLMQLAWLGAKEQAAEQGGWISVEDSLPIDGEQVIVVLGSGHTTIALYLRDDFIGDFHHLGGSEWNASCLFGATHWQPLPASPKKEQICKQQAQ